MGLLVLEETPEFSAQMSSMWASICIHVLVPTNIRGRPAYSQPPGVHSRVKGGGDLRGQWGCTAHHTSCLVEQP